MARHYVVSGSIGTSAKVQHAIPFVIDTGAGFNVIRRSSLPSGWERFVTSTKELPALGDAGGHALKITHEVLLRVRFGNALYRVTFLVVDKLAIPVLLGTQFTNRHVDAIRCIRGRIDFTRDSLPIIGRGDRSQPWREDGVRIAERTKLASGEEVTVGDESHTLTRIRLCRPCLIPPFTQKKAQVITLLQGLIVTEPKQSVSEKYGVRVMNSVHEVTSDEPFTILLSNFTSKERLLPKGMVVAYASRSPILVHVNGKTADAIMETFGISVSAEAMHQMKTDSEAMRNAHSIVSLVENRLPTRKAREVAIEVLASQATNTGDPRQESGDSPKDTEDDDNEPLSEQVTPIPVEDIGRMQDDEDSDEEKPTEKLPWREQVDLKHLDLALKRQVMKMLEKHEEVFEGRLGLIKSTEHRITLKPGSKPVHMPPYRAGPDKRDKIREQIEYQLNAGVIEPAQTEWASPVLLAPKKDGTQRFCVDFRLLNEATVPDTYPLPRMDDCIDSLSLARVYSLLDALWGYWQLKLAEEDRDKTTFTSHMGTFRYLRMPFGLRNAPSSFQRALDIVLSGVRWRICLVYLDDVIVFSRNNQEHIEHLDQVLSLLKGAGIKLKLKKCFFFRQEVEYLGFRIRPGTLSAYHNSKAIVKVRNAEFPQTPTIMKSFLGCCNVYRRFIRSFAVTSTPLTDMLKKDSGVDWNSHIEPTEEQREAFETLKDALTKPPVLALPVRDRPYMLDCDASAYAIGVVLLQQQNDDKPTEWATVGYFSKTLTKEQRNYSASERECYAVVWGVLTLRPYLEVGSQC